MKKDQTMPELNRKKNTAKESRYRSKINNQKETLKISQNFILFTSTKQIIAHGQ